MDMLISVLERAGEMFCRHGLTMLLQFCLLTAVLFIIDRAIRKRVKVSIRYCLWSLLLVKLFLPTTFALPTGIGNFLHVNIASRPSQVVPVVEPVETPIVNRPALHNAATNPASLPIAASEPVSVSPQYNMPNRQGLVFGVWLVGVLVFLVVFVQRLIFVRTIIAQSTPAKGRLLDTLQSCCRKIGITTPVRLCLSDTMQSPAVSGLLYPTIVVPKALLEKMSHQNLTAILMHELAHIKRADLWVNLIQTILQILYFYNPLLWLVNAYLRRIREQAVDEMVIWHLGGEVTDYSNTLIDVAEAAFARPHFSLGQVGIVESKNQLKERIRIMLNKPMPKNAKIGIVGFMFIFITAAVLLPMASAKDVKVKAKNKTKNNVSEVNVAPVPVPQVLPMPEMSQIIMPEAPPLPYDSELQKEQWEQKWQQLLANIAKMQVEIQQCKTEMEKIAVESQRSDSEEERDALEERLDELGDKMDEISDKYEEKIEAAAEGIEEWVEENFDEEKMEQWAEKFGKQMEQWGTRFGAQMALWGAQFGEQMSKMKDTGKIAFERTQQLSSLFPKGATLIAKTDTGAITVTGGDVKECTVTAKIIARADAQQKAEELANQAKVNITNEEGKLFVKTDADDSVTVDLNITVPKNANIQCKTDVGAISITDISGTVRAKTDVGAIDCNNVSSNVDAKTDVGKITVICADNAAGHCAIQLKTDVGAVDFTSPKNLSAAVKAKAEIGDIETNLPLTITKTDTGQQTEGTVGDGKGSIVIKTEVGAIKINNKE